MPAKRTTKAKTKAKAKAKPAAKKAKPVAKVAKVAKPKAAAPAEPTSTPDFPFVGAGDAEYFEYCEMHVRFTRAPTSAEAKKLRACVPEILTDPFELTGPNLWVASEQGVGRMINAFYGKTKKAPSKLTTQSRFTMSAASADKRFEQDIVRWLVESHAIVPILVAFRRHDFEAGGTVLDDWGKASLQKVPAILEALLAGGTLGEADQELGERIVDTAAHDKHPVAPALAKKFGA